VKIRNPKHEIRNKSKSRKGGKFKGRKRADPILKFPPLSFELVSDFGFRISDFPPFVASGGFLVYEQG